jgi:catechol 2,3-dioxygenase-like lactoylglutathione lyase family enzyme
MDIKIELIIVPVTDVDRAKEFYERKAGFHADIDQSPKPGLRFVQLTPPGSACSIAIGEGITPAKPGSLKGIQAVVKDAGKVRAELVKRGVECTDVDEQPWGKFVFFKDPDGNAWSLQELVKR